MKLIIDKIVLAEMNNLKKQWKNILITIAANPVQWNYTKLINNAVFIISL